MEILKLLPVGKGYLWGGTKLKEVYDKKIDITPLAETWECSVHPDGLSVVAFGKYENWTLLDVIKQHPEYLGSKVTNGELPILVKFIDARDNLSIQVHPDDEYAQKYENQNGKTEMWYIIDADEGANIVYGFKHKVTPEILKQAIENGKLDRHMNKVEVHKGETYYVPAGTIHGIGSGVLIAEIQENSNLTYRIYDYNRVDKNGNKRELHFNKAIQVMDMMPIERTLKKNKIINYHVGYSKELLCRCKYFETERVEITKDYLFTVTNTSFQVLLCLEGKGRIVSTNAIFEEVIFGKGDTLFLPANIGTCSVYGRVTLLKIRC